MLIILVCIATGALVGFAIYRQVRAHLELRRSLYALEKKGNLVVDHLTGVIESLESLTVTEQGTLKDIQSPVAEDTIYIDTNKALELYLALYGQEVASLDRVLRHSPYRVMHIKGKLLGHLQCLESPEAQVRIWLEEDRSVQHIEPAYTW